MVVMKYCFVEEVNGDEYVVCFFKKIKVDSVEISVEEKVCLKKEKKECKEKKKVKKEKKVKKVVEEV